MKKNDFLSVLAIGMATALCVGFASCSSDDDKDSGDNKTTTETTLTVSGLDAPFGADESSASAKKTMTVSTNAAWGIGSKPEWLDITPQSGSAGTTTVDVYPNSANTSTTERSGEIVIKAGDKEVKKVVTQRTNKSSAYAHPKDVITLTESTVWGYDFSSNTHHVYFTLMRELKANGLTDVDIQEHIKNEVEDDQWVRRTPQEFKEYGNYFSWYGLSTNTKYVLISVSFDSDNKIGEINRKSIATKVDDIYNSPFIAFDNVDFSYETISNQTYYRIKASKDPYYSAYANKIYSWGVAATVDFETFIDNTTYAILAYLMYQEIQKNPAPHDTYVNGTDRSVVRERIEGPVEEVSYTLPANVGNDKYLQVVHWCTLASGDFSGRVSLVWADLQGSSSSRKTIARQASTKTTTPKLIQFNPEKLSKNYHLIRLN